MPTSPNSFFATEFSVVLQLQVTNYQLLRSISAIHRVDLNPDVTTDTSAA